MNLIFSSIICKSLVNQRKSLCNHQLTISDQQFLYCQKANALQTTQIKESMHISQQSSHMFIYTDTVQNSQIQVEMDYVNVFAVFGFNKQGQNIQQSTVNVSLRFSVVQAALICLQCDLSVSQSVLVFQASGQVLSGVMLTAKDNLTLAASRVQFRFWSKQASGLVNQIQAKMTNFSLADVNITGFDGVRSADNGYLASLVSISSPISTTRVLVCADPMTARVGSLDKLAASSEQLACLSVCAAGTSYAYGLCLDDLRLGKYLEANDTYVCVDPFVFNGESCFCKEGFLLDADTCVDVAAQLTNLETWLAANISDIVGQLSNNADLAAKLSALDQHISGNASALNASIRANYDSAEAHLALNTTGLNLKIDASVASINSQIQSNTAQLLKVVLDNSTALDQRISDNSSVLNARLNLVNASMLDAVKKVYENITAVNATVSQLSANLDAGVASINTKLAALDANLLSNVTAINASILDLKNTTARDIVQINETLLNSTDQLQANILVVNATLLAVNGSLSSSISQVNGTLTAMNATFINNVSMINSTIMYINTLLLGNITQLNIFTNNTLNDIQTNISNTNNYLSKMISDQNKTIDTLMLQIFDAQNQVIDLNQAELDPQFDFSDDFNIDLVCAQQVFTQSFDITTITNSIQTSNFTGAFVFDGVNVNNAFLDVTDNSIQAASFSIFRSQTYFYNLKIQLGAQNLLSSSIVAESGVQMVNKMSIISKTSSTLQVQSAQILNVLSRTSSGTSIRNLLVNLAFASGSAGSVDLIYSASGALNVRNYQVAGSYYSSQSSCLGAFSTVNGQVSLQNVNFNPTVLIFGNTSSYLFAVFTQSSLQIQKIVISVGVSANPNIIASISSSAASQFVFGGIVAVSSQSKIDLRTSVFKVFSKFDTAFLNYTGQIFGQLTGANIVSVSQTCYQESVQLHAASKVHMGAIGLVEGVFSLSKSSFTMSLAGDANIQGFGTVAFISQLNTKSMFSDLTLQVQLGAKTTTYDEQNVSALVGRQLSLNWTVQNIVFNQLILLRGMQIGSISSFCENTLGYIENVQIENSTIASISYINSISGGFIGQVFTSTVNIQYLSMSGVVHNSVGTSMSYTGIGFGYVLSSSIIINQIIINKNNITAFSTSSVSYAGLMAAIVSSQLNVNNVNMITNNLTISGFADVIGGYIIGQYNTSTNVILEDIQIINSQMNGIGLYGANMASLTIGNINTVNVNILQLYIIESLLLVSNDYNSTYVGIVVGKSQYSQIVSEFVQLEQNTLNGTGRLNCYFGGIVGMLNASNLQTGNYRAVQLYLNSSSMHNNISTGGVIGQSNNSIINNSIIQLQEFTVINSNISSYGREQSMMGGFIGSIIKSNLSFVDIQIANVSITSTSSFTANEVNNGGFVGTVELFSNLLFQNCSALSIQVWCWSNTTSRAVLFIGKIENSTANFTLIELINSNATSKLTNQPRAGGFLGRVYYSTIIATQIYSVNNFVEPIASGDDSYGSGIATSIGNTTFTLQNSRIFNFVVKAQSQTSLVQGSTIFAHTNMSTIQIQDVVVEHPVINVSTSNTKNVYVGLISAELFSPNGYQNILNINNYFVNMVDVNFNGNDIKFGVIDGQNDMNTKYFISNSHSEGWLNIFEIAPKINQPLSNCADFKKYDNGATQQYTSKTGC
ncbi:Hypothetical_protein [Hexamita inflata]|uniref:Hypothetical_protein n=1 Tax=Hexamita inflata TaxID=28002 RepID=A0AA86U6Q8_9EUKA|nr:Hypothetical protein HINF_LOCUS19728 [Hexamita inflata]